MPWRHLGSGRYSFTWPWH